MLFNEFYDKKERVRYKQRQRRSGVDSTWRRRANGRRAWHVRSTVDDDCRLLIALGVQLCVQRNGRFGVRHRRAGPIGVS